ncbi:MAG: hypothetical protein EON59_13465 [Alphaproteobacteria bacterium]|nr:MAG: hypothetical protein EON59_13465 [Alphaproteobacteria bacterium]
MSDQPDTVVVPREPTEAMLRAARDWSAAKYGKPIGNDGAIGCYRAMISQAPAAGGGDVDYEIWQADGMVASSTTLPGAMHYAAVYGQDDPVEVFEVTRRKIAALSSKVGE